MNVENKKIWDGIFQQQPPVNNDDCCVMCESENGEYVPASAVQHDRHCYAGYSGRRDYPATQHSGGVPLHRRVGRCFCPAGWGCFEKEKVRCI